MTDGKLLTQQDACELLGTFPRKFNREAERQGIPCQRIGGLKLYTYEDVVALLPHIRKDRRAAASA